MTTQIACPACKTNLRIPDAITGSKVKCPGCKTVFLAESPGEDDTDFALDDEPVGQPNSGPTSDIVALTDVQPTSGSDSEVGLGDFDLDEVAEGGSSPRLGEGQTTGCNSIEEPDAHPSSLNYPCPHCGQTFCSASPAGTVVSCCYCHKNVSLLPPTNEQNRGNDELDDALEVLPVADSTPHSEIRYENGKPYYPVGGPPRNVVWCPDCGKGTKVTDVHAVWACAWCNARFQFNHAEKEHLPLAPGKRRNRKRKATPRNERTADVRRHGQNISCPHCQGEIIPDWTMANKTVWCPLCKGYFKMPANANQAPQPVPPPLSYGDTGWFGLRRVLKATCPRCQGVVYWGPCPNCGVTEWQKHEIPVSNFWGIHDETEALDCANRSCPMRMKNWPCPHCGCLVRALAF